MTTTQTIPWKGRVFELRPLGEPSGAWEWREVAHGWHVASSEQHALLMIGGHGRYMDGREPG